MGACGVGRAEEHPVTHKKRLEQAVPLVQAYKQLQSTHFNSLVHLAGCCCLYQPPPPPRQFARSSPPTHTNRPFVAAMSLNIMTGCHDDLQVWLPCVPHLVPQHHHSTRHAAHGRRWHVHGQEAASVQVSTSGSSIRWLHCVQQPQHTVQHSRVLPGTHVWVCLFVLCVQLLGLLLRTAYFVVRRTRQATACVPNCTRHYQHAYTT